MPYVRMLDHTPCEGTRSVFYEKNMGCYIGNSSIVPLRLTCHRQALYSVAQHKFSYDHTSLEIFLEEVKFLQGVEAMSTIV